MGSGRGAGDLPVRGVREEAPPRPTRRRLPARRAATKSTPASARVNACASDRIRERRHAMNNSVAQTVEERLVRITAGPVRLDGNLSLPEGSRAVVLFAHGSGSSRHSSRNRHVARLLNEAKLATLLIDLLTLDEEEIDARTARLRFDIDLLAERLVGATDWVPQ